MKIKNLRVLGGFPEVSLIWPTSLAQVNYFIVFYCFFYIIGILEIREIAYNLIPQNLIIHGTIIIPNSLPLLSLYQFQNWDHNIYVLLYIDFCLFVLLSISILFLFSIITDFKNIVVKKKSLLLLSVYVIFYFSFDGAVRHT